MDSFHAIVTGYMTLFDVGERSALHEQVECLADTLTIAPQHWPQPWGGSSAHQG